MEQIKSRIKQRHDTLANWEQHNIVLLDGELAIVDCGAQTRLKVGNGLSTFNQLPFIDQEVLSTTLVDAHAISQGTQAHSTPFGLASGYRLSANANYSQALGFKSQTSAGHDFSFAWNGNDQQYSILGDQYYTSHGKGTFNINPLSGANGFFIGDTSLSALLSASAGSKSKVTIGNDPSPVDLSVYKVTADEYAQKLADGVLSNELYIVSSLELDAFGQHVKNVAPAVELSDAVNLQQLSTSVGSVSSHVDTVVQGISSSIDELSDSISFVSSAVNSVSSQVDAISSSIDEKSSISIDNQHSDLNIVHVSMPEYAEKLSAGNVLSNELYIVSSLQLDAFGQQIKNVAPGTDLSDAVNLEQMASAVNALSSELSASLTAYYTKSETSSASEVAGALAGKLSPSEVKIAYVHSGKQIVLSARDSVTSVDCADFIKDGMLSTAELCGTTLVLNFNTDAGSDPISVELSDFVDDYDSKVTSLSNAIDHKVFVLDQVSGISGYADLSVVKLNASQYASALADGTALSNAIYVVNDDHFDAFGEQVKNVAPATDLSDAVNLEQLSTSVGTVSSHVDTLVQGISSSIDALSDGIGSLSDGISFMSSSVNSVSSQVSTISSSLSEKSSISIDNQHSDLNIVHVSMPEYAQLLSSGVPASTLYVVSSLELDAFGQQVKNVAYASDLSDAVNLEQMQSFLSGFYQKSETSSAAEISTALSALSSQMGGDCKLDEFAAYDTTGYLSAYGTPEKDTATQNISAIASAYTDQEKFNIGIGLGMRYRLINLPWSHGTVDIDGEQVEADYARVEDFAVTTLTISSDTYPKVIYMPPVVDGRCRDLLIKIKNRLDQNASNIYFYPTTGETIDFESDDTSWGDIEPGINFLLFTETERV